MNIIQDLEKYKKKQSLVLSLGMFDGVHLGHQSIINHLKVKSREIPNSQTAILTFWPHPRLVFNPNDDLKLLNTIDEKIELMDKFGIDNMILKSFDETFRNLTGEEFVKEILIEKLNVKYLVVGYDHVFGKNKSGNFQLLKNLSQSLNYQVEQMEAINLLNENVSSTKIRNALQLGNIVLSNEMLGYNYSVSGKVIHGKKIGRTIGFPTANISVDSQKLLPKKGAYIVEVLVENQLYKGMLSIGTNPTVGGEKLSVEVNILDFSKDIYEQEITIYFKDFLHDEIQFESLEKLIDRLNEDEQITRDFFLN